MRLVTHFHTGSLLWAALCIVVGCGALINPGAFAKQMLDSYEKTPPLFKIGSKPTLPQVKKIVRLIGCSFILMSIVGIYAALFSDH